ncbi:DUF309 domain-containing protein [Seohaeicola saemankumensis]|nr:DUF309 domain-containing protein [Seohaeicola saemankumensis]MCA0870690.1 DUF309 domain-containing protein [Seohaeicola saemankumensis]
MSAAELAGTDAWRAGWQYFETGFYWEAHELWEPVWMALPEGAPDRALVQASIQLANACLKARMGRLRAVFRLCDIAQGLLDGGGWQGCAAMDVPANRLRMILDRLRGGESVLCTEPRKVQNNA